MSILRNFRGIAILSILISAHGVAAEDARPVDFAREILPILSENCFACHGPDEAHRAADLRLDVEDAAKEYAIIPGSAGDSEVILRLTSDDDEMRMPPADSGKQLSPEQIELIRRWIDQGASWAQHWAFVPPSSPPVPDVEASDWPQNEVDHFVLARLQAEDLQPSPPATRAAWLRRVSFDLTGLPPTPAEVAEFAQDTSADAYEKQIDRLLRSPHYGERMAIEWLDLARFADTNGYQNDFNRSMWPWRDWVINAYNTNMPADQFLIEQIAGDLLPNPTTSQLIATGFNRNHRMVTEAGSIDEEWRVENVVDRVETTSTAFLGLTMGCARCHTHKYDPISHEDFYQFYAFFNNVDEKGVYVETRGNVPPLISVPTAEEQQKLADLDKQIAALQQQTESASVDLAAFFAGTHPRVEGAPAVPLPQPTVQFLLNKELRLNHDGAPTAASGDGTQAVTYAGGQPTWVPSPVGESLDFTGTEESHVDAGQSFVANADQPMAWSLWTRVDRPGALLSKMDDQQGYRGFDTILLDDHRLKVHLIDTWPDNALAVTTKTPIPRDAWCHIAVSYDGSRKAEGIQVWLDGRPMPLNLEQVNLTGTLETTQPLRVGRRSTALFLDGTVALVQLYNQTLSTETVDLARRQELRDRLGEGEPDLATLPTPVRDYLVRQQGQDVQQQLQSLKEERASFEKTVQTTMIMGDRPEYRPTYLLQRGTYDAPDTSTELWPEVPDFLGALPEDAPRNRLSLAQWMVDPSNPLVARVIVNRIWQRLFGTGLVATPGNFGLQGDRPSHPELLDWLAVRLIDSGWDIKYMHKLIASSATYQQASEAPPELVSHDPGNRLLARGPRHRLTAELVRDNALAVSGLLTTTIGGRSVMPYQPEGLWSELAGGANGGPYVVENDENLYRRSLYTFRKRTVAHPTLGTFDAPSWEICQAKRGRTNTPLQSLALLNDTTYVEAARHLAQRMISEGGEDLPSRLRHGFKLATLRDPKQSELATLAGGYEHYLGYYQHDAQATAEFLSQGKSPLADELKTPELAALSTVAAVLLNLDETITK